MKNQTTQGLRCLAIVIIMLSHMYGYFNKWGAAGVSIFLGISGYYLCKTGIVGNTNWNIHSVIYKLIKIYPLYLLVTLITATYFNANIVYGVSKAKNNIILLTNLLMIQTLFRDNAFRGAFSQVGWYIPIVFFSIILGPLFVWIWKKLNRVSAAVVLAAILFIEVLMPVIFAEWDGLRWLVYSNPLWRQLDIIAGGCVFLMVKDYQKKKTSLALKPIALVALAVGLTASFFLKGAWVSTVLWLIPAWLILLEIDCIDGWLGKLVSFRPFVYVGNISFEIFLVHYMIMHLYSEYLWPCTTNILTVGLYVVIVLAISSIVHICDEKIVTWYKRKFMKA